MSIQSRGNTERSVPDLILSSLRRPATTDCGRGSSGRAGVSTFNSSSFHSKGSRRRSFHPAMRFHVREITWIFGLNHERQITACRIGLLGSSRPNSQAVLTVEAARSAAACARAWGRGVASCRRGGSFSTLAALHQNTLCAATPRRSQRLTQGTAHHDTCRPDRLRRRHMCLGLRLQFRAPPGRRADCTQPMHARVVGAHPGFGTRYRRLPAISAWSLWRRWQWDQSSLPISQTMTR